jgi:uncharacterized membrane protein
MLKKKKNEKYVLALQIVRKKNKKITTNSKYARIAAVTDFT